MMKKGRSVELGQEFDYIKGFDYFIRRYNDIIRDISITTTCNDYTSPYNDFTTPFNCLTTLDKDNTTT